MNPLLIALLGSFGPAALSKLFGGQTSAQGLQKKLLALIQSQPQLAQKLYQQNLASPAFSQGQQAIATGANVTGANIAREMGHAGITGSGTGAIASSIVPSIVGSQQAGLKTAAFNSAQSQAENQIRDQINALTGTSGPSQSQQLLGGGLEAFGGLLQNWLKNKYPMFAAQTNTTR